MPPSVFGARNMPTPDTHSRELQSLAGLDDRRTPYDLIYQPETAQARATS